MDLSKVASHTPDEDADGRRNAAVVVPIMESGGEYSILFVKRSDNLGEHPGQMAFPGGSQEPSDEGILATAFREATEEIGLTRDESEVIGPLDPISTVSDYAVSPFVVEVPDRGYDPDGREIEEIAKIDVDAILTPRNYESERRSHPKYGTSIVHFFHVDGYTVWGATGRILAQFLELAYDWAPPNGPNEA
ncbi:MAG: CoA pyrophosphatase [Halobacteriaceae archaeon]